MDTNEPLNEPLVDSARFLAPDGHPATELGYQLRDLLVAITSLILALYALDGHCAFFD